MGRPDTAYRLQLYTITFYYIMKITEGLKGRGGNVQFRFKYIFKLYCSVADNNLTNPTGQSFPHSNASQGCSEIRPLLAHFSHSILDLLTCNYKKKQ